MVTKRKSELAKARGDVRRSLSRFMMALPMVARFNWRNVVMPWRMIPMPVAMALIALVALAMVLDTGDAPASASTGEGVTIGADTVAPGTACEEDEVITYRVLMGGQGVGCVHFEWLAKDFVGECLIGNSAEHPRVTPNLATYHLRDPAFRSWCDAVIDDMSDGVVSLDDLLFDLAYTSEVSSTVQPAITPAITPTVTPTATMALPPMALPNTGSR